MKICIVGGGVAGLELATRLGRKLGKDPNHSITLIDRNDTHLWKPLLHEVASGSLDMGVDSLSYRAQAANHRFKFRIGSLVDLDRYNRKVWLAPLHDAEGREVLPSRSIDYDILVLSLGSVTNDFGVTGVKDHAYFLDSTAEAERFHAALLNGLLKLESQGLDSNSRYRVAIVGGGATGVELSAELYNTFESLRAYGLDKLKPNQLEVTLLEAGPRILPGLPERISGSAHSELEKIGVKVRTETQVASAQAGQFETASGELIEADLLVWAAGVKVPDSFEGLGGLETNRTNQWVVQSTLQTTLDERIYALGDCAACSMEDGNLVPPRAQSAHQMASLAYENILKQIKHESDLKDYQYVDYGSLVNLSRYSTVGNLMGNLSKGSMMVEGVAARFMYVSLYRMHQLVLHGWFKTGLRILVDRINKVIRPRLKLH